MATETKRIFVDTNVILEGMLHRQLEAQANCLMDAVYSGQLKGYLSAGSFYTILFYAEQCFRKRYSDKEHRMKLLRYAMNDLLQHFTVVPQGNIEMHEGVNDMDFHDLEDSCQLQAALSADCDLLVTINTADFSSQNPLPVVHLADFEVPSFSNPSSPSTPPLKG